MAKRLRVYAPAWVSAALFGVASQFSALGFLACIALVPWLLAILESDRRHAWRSGLWFGLIFAGSQLVWLGQFVGKWTSSLAAGGLTLVLGTCIIAPFWGIFGLLAQRAFEKEAWWKVPFAWAAVELLRSYVPMFAFPWALAANPVREYLPVVQVAHVGSVFSVSATVVLVNLLVLARWKREIAPKQWVAKAGAAVVTLFVISICLYLLPVEGRRLKVMIVQPGLDMAFGDPKIEANELEPRINRALREALSQKCDLLVLPEGVGGRVRSLPPSLPFNFDQRVAVVLGIQYGAEPTYQSALGWDGRWQVAHKTRLVIFGEFVPFRSTFPAIAQAFKLPSGDLSAGPDGVRALSLRKVTVGPILCFEGLFPDIAYRQLWNKSELLAVMSIDDWYMGSAAPQQLHAGARWRAIETGLPVVRAASLGISDSFDPKGRRLSSPIAIGENSNRVVEITLPKPQRWPAITAILFAIFSTAVSLSLVIGRRRSSERRA